MTFHPHPRTVLWYERQPQRSWRDACVELLAYLAVAGAVVVFIVLMMIVPEIPITILLLFFLALCVACLRIYQLANAQPPYTSPLVFSSTV